MITRNGWEEWLEVMGEYLDGLDERNGWKE